MEAIELGPDVNLEKLRRQLVGRIAWILWSGWAACWRTQPCLALAFRLIGLACLPVWLGWAFACGDFAGRSAHLCLVKWCKMDASR